MSRVPTISHPLICGGSSVSCNAWYVAAAIWFPPQPIPFCHDHLPCLGHSRCGSLGQSSINRLYCFHLGPLLSQSLKGLLRRCHLNLLQVPQCNTVHPQAHSSNGQGQVEPWDVRLRPFFQFYGLPHQVVAMIEAISDLPPKYEILSRRSIPIQFMIG